MRPGLGETFRCPPRGCARESVHLRADQPSYLMEGRKFPEVDSPHNKTVQAPEIIRQRTEVRGANCRSFGGSHGRKPQAIERATLPPVVGAWHRNCMIGLRAQEIIFPSSRIAESPRLSSPWNIAGRCLWWYLISFPLEPTSNVEWVGRKNPSKSQSICEAYLNRRSPGIKNEP